MFSPHVEPAHHLLLSTSLDHPHLISEATFSEACLWMMINVSGPLVKLNSSCYMRARSHVKLPADWITWWYCVLHFWDSSILAIGCMPTKATIELPLVCIVIKRRVYVSFARWRGRSSVVNHRLSHSMHYHCHNISRRWSSVDEKRVISHGELTTGNHRLLLIVFLLSVLCLH